jgi:phosphate transport system substrate-binding protein
MQGEFHPKQDPFSIFGASIGYSFRFYLSGIIANENVKMLEVNGVYPNEENIRNGSYPITAKFYVVYRKDNTNTKVKTLVDWLLSNEGQAMIEGCGYVGLQA